MIAIRLARFAMNCEFEATLRGSDRSCLEQVASLALDDVESLDAKLSCFSPTSELSYVNSEAHRRPVIVSPELFEILVLARQVWSETGGAFDVTAGPLIELWREAERTGAEPPTDSTDSALSRSGMRHLVLDADDNSVRFDVEGLRINLGGIGKGYAIRRAAEILLEYGVDSALLSAGGSTVYGLGVGPGDDGWRIGIRHPSDPGRRVAEPVLRDRAISTSGGPAQRDELVTERFEHIIDARTGRPASSGLASASVITTDPALADALSTSFYLLGTEFARAYCRGHGGVQAVIVEADSEAEEPVVWGFGPRDN